MVAWENPSRKGKGNVAKLLEKNTFEVLPIDLDFHLFVIFSAFVIITIAAIFFNSLYAIEGCQTRKHYPVEVKLEMWRNSVDSI